MALLTRLREHLSGQDCLIVHNAASLHKNLALTAALHRFSEVRERNPDYPLAP